MTNSSDRIILIDKPSGISSFGVVARVRYFLTKQLGHKVKVGHCGTLDPFATGLLILVTGQNTKQAGNFSKLDKVYRATMRLGATSTTGDPEGEITLADVDPPDQQIVEQTISSFIGQSEQTPPSFSAIKINGQRAYKLARAGKRVDIEPRTINIYSLNIISYQYPELIIETHVSSGTYIRSLASDIGNKLGTGAYLTDLRRISIGQWSIDSAESLDQYSVN